MSEKSIAQKLQIKEGYKVILVNPPRKYRERLVELPRNVVVVTEEDTPADIIQVFVSSKKELEQQLPKLKEFLGPTGIMWVTYPKGTSKIKADVNRDTIRKYAETVGLEAVAIFSVDDDWSALRLKLV